MSFKSGDKVTLTLAGRRGLSFRDTRELDAMPELIVDHVYDDRGEGRAIVMFKGMGPLNGWFAHRFALVNEFAPTSQSTTLNSEDPFEAAVERLVKLNRKKRADYALDSDPWSNFRLTAERHPKMDTPLDAVMFNVHQKMVRLEALRANGRAPENEAVEDTYDDLAVYFVIAGILAKEEGES